jgi:hypothetical protein
MNQTLANVLSLKIETNISTNVQHVKSDLAYNKWLRAIFPARSQSAIFAHLHLQNFFAISAQKNEKVAIFAHSFSSFSSPFPLNRGENGE